jgi:cell wall-associated NlpC family hydrolase
MTISTFACCFAFAQAPALAQAPAGGSGPDEQAEPEPGQTGGWEYGAEPARPMVAGTRAKLIDGVAHAPELAPPAVQEAIWAANQLVGKPYRYGGGHGRFDDTGYDCSGTVSFALHGGNLLESPLDSSSFMSWGARGKGQWVTIYTNPGHAFAVIAGLRLDTSAAGDRSGLKGPRWRPRLRSTRGFRTRHPLGL